MLETLIKQQIEQSGPVTLADYMHMALYDERYGYYRTQNPLGKEGDFTTSPEISQMFGELLGAWLANQWQAMGEPSDITLLELGPGRGTLMSDILRATSKINGFHNAISIHLLEINEALIQEQEKTLADVRPSLHWHATLDSLPSLPVLCIANEFFDALPIHQFQKTENSWQEKYVTVENDKLAFCWCDNLSKDCLPLLERYNNATPDTILEISPDSIAVIETLANHIKNHGGTGLIIDYGYFQGSGDSLQAMKHHRYHDPLETPGEADLTSHVNFAALIKTALECGINAYGNVTQGQLLTALGIQVRAQMLCQKTTPDQQQTILNDMHRLIAEEEMGSLFKCMALTPPNTEPPYGFD